MAETKTTVCNRDCPDACTIEVTVEAGRAVKLQGSADDPITRGFLCERTGRFLQRQYAANRITSPLRRRGDGTLEAISWDAALDLAAEKLLRIKAESGAAAILHYRSGGSLGILRALSNRLFARFGPVSVTHGDICSGAGEAAQATDFGLCDSHDVFDLLNSRLVVLWGRNPHVSWVHSLPVFKDAKARGAVFVGIDPVRTKAAAMCDRFIQPRPGGDFHLAMAVSRSLIDRGAVTDAVARTCTNFPDFERLATSRSVDAWAAIAGVERREIDALADLFQTRRPANIQVGWGLGRRRNGSAAVRAIDALGVISGNLGVPGGGVTYYYGRRRAFDMEAILGDQTAPRSFLEPCLGPEVLAAVDPPVRAVWITCGNPVSMLPDSHAMQAALRRAEFVVTVDTHPTDTTDCAHLILPTLTLLEDEDLFGAFGNHWIRESRAAIAPPEGPRHELTIWQGMARRLGVADAMAGSIDEWKKRALSRLEVAGVTLDGVRAGPQRNPFAPTVLFAGGKTAHSHGKTELVDTEAAAPPVTDAEWPFTLLAASTAKAQSSQWSVDLGDALADVRVHPESAPSIADGGRARLESRLATMEVIVRHDPTLRRDVVVTAKGGMLRDGRCANALIAAVPTDAGGGAAYYDEAVRLIPA